MRGKVAPKRYIAPDAQYGSVLVAKLVNYVMEDGKKSIDAFYSGEHLFLCGRPVCGRFVDYNLVAMALKEF